MSRPTLDILCLDDNPDTLEGLRRLFTKLYGLTVGTASTIAEGREIADATPPRMLVADDRMPDGSGIDFLAGEKARNPALRSVVGTGYSDDETYAAAIAAGADAVLIKPLVAEGVAAALGLPEPAKS